jgi:acetyl esterase/lipase
VPGTLISVGTIAWTTLGLLAAALIVVPGPNASTWFLGVMVEGYSLALAAYGLVGLALAGLSRDLGASGIGLVAMASAAATLALGVVPVWQGLRAASAQHVRLSLREYFSHPTWVPSRSPESVTYSDPSDCPGGLQLDVWRPADPGMNRTAPKRAAVIMVHGGGWVSGARGGTARWSEWLADRGYVVFDIDYRLAPPPRWRDAPDDVNHAVRWVKDHADLYGVDPGRVALLGHSAGGHLALLAAYSMRAPALPRSDDVHDRGVRAVAALYPITDLTAPFDRRGPRWAASAANAQIIQFLGGAPRANAQAARLASPVSHVVSGVPPTFLVHGRRDQMVPVEQSQVLDTELHDAAADHVYVELPGANHGYDLVWGAWHTQITRAVLHEFFQRHLTEPT